MKIKIDSKSSALSNIEKFDNNEISINTLLNWCTKNSCSDLFIRVGERPYVNRFGRIVPLNCEPIDVFTWDEWANYAIDSEKNAQYVRDKMYDFAYVYGGFRYRINVGYSRDANILTARMINPTPPAFVECGGDIIYPEGAKEALRNVLSNGKGGMVIFSAPTGNGKTTTLGCCINSWEGYDNPLHDTNIVTLEDPIEYIYNSKQSTRIIQKELGKDFMSFELGIKAAMREHPTHILIGELRDKQTIRAAIEAGRSGHTLMTTFHCRDIPSTCSRLLDNFSGSIAEGADLISNISLIICQRLVGRPDSDGYYLECEYATFDYEIKNLISEALKSGDNIEHIVNQYVAENQEPGICGKEDTLNEIE